MARNRFYENTLEKVVTVPGTLASGATTGATWLDISQYERFVFKMTCGTSTATAATLQVIQALDSTGTGSKNITTSVATLATSPANGWIAVETQSDHLDIQNGFRYVNVTYTLTGSTAIGFVEFKGIRQAHTPVVQNADSLAVTVNDLQ